MQMLRAVAKLAGLALLIIAGTAGLYWYTAHDQTQQQLHDALAKNQQLQQIIQRIGDEKRVADVLVTEQKLVNGIPETTLLFVETARDGHTLPPKCFKIKGRMIHVSAQIIRFDPQLVKEGDPLRGHSIALFTSIYGDQEKPADAQLIDAPDQIPDAYRGADPRVSKFELSLWQDFWKLFQDENYRKEKGVIATFGQDVWGPFEPDKLYTITLQANGALSLTSSPLKSIYREALKQRMPG
jgi:hypothetical protein